MAERQSEEGTLIVRRGPRWGRIAMFAALGLLILLAIAIGVVWLERRPIATHYLKGEFERRGVTASYHLDRVGFRTQEVHDLVIGDPKRPDLIAKHAIIQMRLKWDGSFEVYRVFARGVRLRGRLIHGKVSWGQIDRLLPPPTNKAFELPNVVLDVADSSIALATPFGPVGVALVGSGRLSGGFRGTAAISSPHLVPGRCAAHHLHAHLAVSVVARRPEADGPVTLESFTCPLSKFDVVAPRFDVHTSFNEEFTRVDGRGRMAIQTLNAGVNGLAAFIGDITFKGPLNDVSGRVRLAAQQSRMATIHAARTRLSGGYRLGLRSGTFDMLGDYAAENAALDPAMLAGVTGPLRAAAKTPIGPVATSISNAISRTASNFNIGGQIHVVNFPGGGAARVNGADVIGPNAARARISGGTGVTYYWPAAALRIDSNIQMAGGGLPSGRVSLRQPAAGAPMSGVAELAPYAAGGQRLALAPIRFGPGSGGLDRAQHRRPARRFIPQWARAGAAPADPGPDRPRRELRLRHGLRGGQLQFPADELDPARRDAAAGLSDRRCDHLEAGRRRSADRRANQPPGAERQDRKLAAAPDGCGRAADRRPLRLQRPLNAPRQAGVADRF